jgi:hypothetical protein
MAGFGVNSGSYGVNTGGVSSVPPDLRPAAPRTAKPVAPKALTPKPPTDPFAPLTAAQIQTQAQTAAGRLGTPQTPQQIQSSAQGMLDPIIQAITANIGKQTATASANIRGNASSLAQALAGVDYGSPYTGAEAKQASIDAALQQSLTGGGQQLAGDLASRLAAIGPAVPAAASGLASRAAAIGTNAQAVGSGALSDLVAQEAAARSYGQKLPGLAQEQGLQDISGVEAAGVKTPGDQTASVMQQLPSIVQNLRAAAANLTGDRAAAVQHVIDTLTGQNITKATASAALGRANAAASPTFNASNSRALGYPVDQYGNRIGSGTLPGYTTDKNGNVVKAPRSGAGAKPPKPLSPASLTKLSKVAEDLRYGVQPKTQFNSRTQKWMAVPNTGTPNSSYSEAYRQLISLGATPAWALAKVNSLYQPGEFGRPPTAASFNASKSQVPTVGTRMKGADGATYVYTAGGWVKH